MGKSPERDRFAYREFGGAPDPASERPAPESPPERQDLRVQASRSGRAGKTVTVISGFQLRPESLVGLLKRLKSACGAGGTVKDNTIEIQGDHRSKILQVLTEAGYKAKISGG